MSLTRRMQPERNPISDLFLGQFSVDDMYSCSCSDHKQMNSSKREKDEAKELAKVGRHRIVLMPKSIITSKINNNSI